MFYLFIYLLTYGCFSLSFSRCGWHYTQTVLCPFPASRPPRIKQFRSNPVSDCGFKLDAVVWANDGKTLMRSGR